jgi:simple sugar transport system substrate-binding protein
MNKRLLALIVLAAALCFLTVQAFADLPIFPNKTPKQMYFRIVTHGGDDPYWAVVHQGMLDACKELGAKADMDFCGADMALQLKRFKEAVAMGCDGIGLVLNDDKVWDAPVAEALAKGIPVISLDTDDSEGIKGNPRLCFIGQDERNAGRMIAARLFAKGKEKGVNFKKAHVAMSVEQPGANYGVMRSDGVKDIMKEYGTTSFEIIDAGGLEQATVQSRQTSYLLAHPETTFFIGLGGICTDRIAASLEAAGYKPGQIVAGGFDPTPGTLAGLKNGYVEATVDAQQYLQGYYPVLVLYLVRRYGFKLNNIDTGGYLVDKNNIGNIDKLSPMHIR